MALLNIAISRQYALPVSMFLSNSVLEIPVSSSHYTSIGKHNPRLASKPREDPECPSTSTSSNRSYQTVMKTRPVHRAAASRSVSRRNHSRSQNEWRAEPRQKSTKILRLAEKPATVSSGFWEVGERSDSQSIQTRTLCPTFAILINLLYCTVYYTSRFLDAK